MSLGSSEYWENRALRFGQVGRGLPAVCAYGMPRLYNEAINLVQAAALAPYLRFGDKRVLDVGCGIGRWSLQLAARGNDVVGVDISRNMIEIASRRNSVRGLGAHFCQADVADLDLEQRFDVILSVTVLQHVIGERDLVRALAQLVRHLADGGRIILLEAAPSVSITRCDTAIFSARTASYYRNLLNRAGLDIVDEAGVDIAPLRPILLPRIGRWPPLLARSLIALTALLSLPVDVLLARRLPEASWHKIFVVERSR